MPSFRWLDDKSKYSGASASATYNTSTPASKAFDGLAVSSNTEGWRTLSNVNSAWIQVKIDEPRIITKLKIDVNADTITGKEPKSFNFLGSNDGSTFENLATFENQTWATKIKEFDVNPDFKRYLYYRLQVLSTIDDGGIFIKEITFGEAIPSNNFLFLHDGVYKKYNFGTGTWDIVTTSSPNYSDYNQGNTLEELSNLDESHWSSLDSNYDFEVLYYTENDIEDCRFELEVEPFSVYDYISENPQAIIYTESTDDIIVSTTTEPFDLYDEFGDEVEVLFYTDDEAVTEADLILEANWSPIDELEGDFEVVTWTDEDSDTAQRVLELTAIPKPQFVKLANPKRLYGYLESILVEDVSVAYRNETRYLLTDEKGVEWYVWDNISQKFVVVDISTHELVLQNGMTYEEVNSITNDQWKTWIDDYVNIGVFLKDNPRDTITSIVENISYSDYLPRHTTSVEKGNFYILNTTAKIDLELVGNVVKGVLSDDDLTRVQYRVFLNNEIYYPADGNFTNLGDSPTNIEIVIPSKDIIMDNWNTVKVEFQDFYGTTDYWQTQFIGTYSGLMFKDIHGDYFSSEIGEVLKYLDFGVIIAGQTTIEHEVILKNQYGYDVKNIHLYADTSKFPNAMEIEFSEALSPFIPQKELMLNRVLANNDEMSFFVRLKTELGATPNANGSFDIIVKADKF